LQLLTSINFSLLSTVRTDLDLETVLWLQDYLIKKFKGTLVVVSHDRYFLNEVVTDVCHFHKGKLTTYRGDINNFTAVLEENKNRQIRLYEQQEAKREHLQKCKFHPTFVLVHILVSTNRD
jgi:ATP-binding cassette subfamily F protein 3